jgi:ferritin-like protein
MSSENLHVPREKLSQEGRLLHNAITSLKEELDAVDWYRQRADDTEDEELKQILLHNMREEMEHAAMVLEWIRRNNEDFAGHLRTYLFTEAPIIAVERAAEGRDTEGAAQTPAQRDRSGGFTIGPLKKGGK